MSATLISAVIITFNEANNIERCLDSLAAVADEIVVVDSFSTDGTDQLCLAKGVRFVQHPFDGHIEQKNYALAQAKHPVVLSLDADEALSPTLRQSILSAKANWQADGYTMNRLTNYCGQWIHHSGWYPDRKLRLFDRRLAQWGGTNPHDRVALHTALPTRHLMGDLWHYSYYTVAEHYARADKYATIAASALAARGKKSYWFNLWLNPALKFLRNYVLKRGFLDGKAGWTICCIAALETHWKYKRLRALGATKTEHPAA